MALVVKGWASTSAIDAEDHSFEPDAVYWPSFKAPDGTLLKPPIELLWHHDRFQPAGKIHTLERRATADGRLGLWCEAIVSPEYAAAPFTGFSVKTRIERYQIVPRPRPYASVTSAVLLEVSLVKKPANPDCIILEREDLPEVTPHLIQSINKARAFQRLIELALQGNQHDGRHTSRRVPITEGKS